MTGWYPAATIARAAAAWPGYSRQPNYRELRLAPQTNEIMNMDVIAGTHGLTECPNHLTIFSDMVTCRQIAKRDLVAERQRLAKAEQNRLSALAHRHDRILA
jgi:hypothetical protein